MKLIAILFISNLLYSSVHKSMEYYFEGINLYRDLKYEDSIIFFKRAYRLNPANREALYRLALSYQNIEKHDMALKILKKLSNVEGYEFVYFAMAKSFYSLGKKNQALQAFDKSIINGFKIYESHFLKGYICFKEGKNQLSIKSFGNIPKNNKLWQASQYYAGLSSMNEAVLKYNKSKKNSIDSNKIIFNLPRKFFLSALNSNDKNNFGIGAKKQLEIIDRLEKSVNLFIDDKMWKVIGTFGHEYESNIIDEENEESIDINGHKGYVNINLLYDLVDNDSWYFSTSTIFNFNKYYSFDESVYANDNGFANINIKSCYIGQPVKGTLEYQFSYLFNDSDADRKVEYRSHTNVITPGISYVFWENQATFFYVPVTIKSNKSENELSNFKSIKFALAQDLRWKNYLSTATLSYDVHNSKTVLNNRKTIGLSYDLSYPLWGISPSAGVSYNKSSFEGGRSSLKFIKTIFNISKTLWGCNWGVKASYDKVYGDISYKRWTMGIYFSYSK